jgi:hypothetical protein
MPRPKSKDPAVRIAITLPKSLVRTSRGMANGAHLSLSAFIAGLIRDRLCDIERTMRATPVAKGE